MQKTIFFFALFLSFISKGEANPCNKKNLYLLLSNHGDGKSEFYSRKQANDCLVLAKEGKVSGISVKKENDGYHKFEIEGGPIDGEPYVRYLKQNKNDFFLSNRLLGGFKYKDKHKSGNRTSSVAKFEVKSCELTSNQCELQNKNFNKDYCQCEDKEKLYCGDKNWRFEKYNSKKEECNKDDEKSWDDETCDCSSVKYCGEKNWSKNKKEREAEKCSDKEGHTWNEESCSCTEKRYCGEKDWSFSKYEKESNNCEKDPKYTWDPASCSCEIDSKTTHMCNGKPYDLTKYNSEKNACEAKNNQSHPDKKFEWDEEKCTCEKEKIERMCGDGESISLKKYERQKNRCLEKMENDDRYSWDQDTCDCLKKKKDKNKNSCGGKGWSQNKIDRKKNHCDSINGKWNAEDCSCDDPCYDVETRSEVEEIPCEDVMPKLGEVSVGDIQAKVCEKAIPEADQKRIKEQCQKEIETIQKSSIDNSPSQKFALKIKYTSKEQILCKENSITVKHLDQLEHPLPANVPTTDLSKFEGDCSKGMGLKDGDLKKYRNYGKISCAQWDSIQEANKEILKIANETTEKFLKDIGITGKVSAQQMNDLLSKSKITMNVIGTANRSNNGTGITLQALASKRQEEAERVMKEQITKKLKEFVTDANYAIPNSETIFKKEGFAQAIGPLNPSSSLKSMHSVLNEPETPPELKKCLSEGQNDTKKTYNCSVDYFIDTECPNLPDALKPQFSQFCSQTKEQLKAQKDSSFLEDFKMFQVGVSLSSEKKQPVYGEIGTIEVDCSAELGTEVIPGSETKITDYLKVTKPGFFRRLKKDCREERRKLNDDYGRKNVRKAANQHKNPNGIVIGQ